MPSNRPAEDVATSVTMTSLATAGSTRAAGSIAAIEGEAGVPQTSRKLAMNSPSAVPEASPARRDTDSIHRDAPPDCTEFRHPASSESVEFGTRRIVGPHDWISSAPAEHARSASGSESPVTVETWDARPAGLDVPTRRSAQTTSTASRMGMEV